MENLIRQLKATNRHLKVRTGPDGILFFNRKTGANFLIDEIQIPPELWSRAPRQISIALTNACDLRCFYCYAPKHAAQLATERVISWLNDLDEHGCLGIGFGGGEPTLHNGLTELCKYAANNTGLAVTFTTHAHRLDDRLATGLTGNVHFIRVSMDGVDSTYERLRGRAFSELRFRLEIVRDIAPFGLNFVVNRDTLPDLDRALGVALEIGATEFLLLPEQTVNGGGGIDCRTAQGLKEWVEKYSGAIPVAVSEIGSEGLPTCNPLPLEIGLRSYAHVDASGVLKTSSYAKVGIPVADGSFMQALNCLELLQR